MVGAGGAVHRRRPHLVVDVGFTPQRKRYRLVFSDPSLEGFEVTMKTLSAGEFLEVAGHMAGLRSLDARSPISEAAVRDTDRLVEIMGGKLVAWNLDDDDGERVPCSVQAIRDLDLMMFLAILEAWTGAIGSVPDPLPGSSPNGGLFPAGSLPMEPLSPSPTSS